MHSGNGNTTPIKRGQPPLPENNKSSSNKNTSQIERQQLNSLNIRRNSSSEIVSLKRKQPTNTQTHFDIPLKRRKSTSEANVSSTLTQLNQKKKQLKKTDL